MAYKSGLGKPLASKSFITTLKWDDSSLASLFPPPATASIFQDAENTEPELGILMSFYSPLINVLRVIIVEHACGTQAKKK